MQTYSNLEQERDRVLSSDENLPSDWPLQGAITFNRATLRYREDFAPVLKEV